MGVTLLAAANRDLEGDPVETPITDSRISSRLNELQESLEVCISLDKGESTCGLILEDGELAVSVLGSPPVLCPLVAAVVVSILSVGGIGSDLCCGCAC